MKKIILGTALAFAFATGMGDVSAIGENNKDTVRIVNEQGYGETVVLFAIAGAVQEVQNRGIASTKDDQKAWKDLVKIAIDVSKLKKKALDEKTLKKCENAVSKLSQNFRSQPAVKTLIDLPKNIEVTSLSNIKDQNVQRYKNIIFNIPVTLNQNNNSNVNYGNTPQPKQTNTLRRTGSR